MNAHPPGMVRALTTLIYAETVLGGPLFDWQRRFVLSALLDEPMFMVRGRSNGRNTARRAVEEARAIAELPYRR